MICTEEGLHSGLLSQVSLSKRTCNEELYEERLLGVVMQIGTDGIEELRKTLPNSSHGFVQIYTLHDSVQQISGSANISYKDCPFLSHSGRL